MWTVRSPAAATYLAATALLVFLAAPGQCTLPTNFSDQLVVSLLNQPSSFAFLPDGRILVTEQRTGAVRVAVASVPTTILTLTDVNLNGTERGLLGVAVDPRWPTRPYVYLYYTETPASKNFIVRYTATGDLTNPSSSNLPLGDRYVIINDIPDDATNHNGGCLRFGPDGMLYASMGEDADACAAQDSTSLKGEILRLNTAVLPAGPGGPPAKSLIAPPDNPFYLPAGSPNANLVWAYGLRNPFRFHIDPLTGRLYIGDVGQSTWEEVDESTGGENFGWPLYEGPSIYSLACPNNHFLTPPASYYDRTAYASASVINATLYRRNCGAAFTFPAEYEGDWFYCDYYQGFVRRLKKSGASWSIAPAVAGQPNSTDWATSIATVSDWLIGPDGALYYCKQFSNPSIRKIVYTGLQPPGAAGSLSAGAVSSSRINLTWSSGGGTVATYDIDRRVPPAPFAPLVSVPGTQVSFADTGLAPSTIHEYRVLARNSAGSCGYSNAARDTTLALTGVGDGGPGSGPPLLAIYPNPWSRSAAPRGIVIRFDGVADGPVAVDLFDVGGRLVRHLLDGTAASGARSVTWDGVMESGRPAGPGVYFVRLRAGSATASRRLVVLPQ